MGRMSPEGPGSTSVDPLCLPLDQIPDPLPIPVIGGRGRGSFIARIRPPGSKSLTNRALLLAALASGRSTLRSPLLDAQDTEVMIAALGELGASVQRSGGDLEVTGVGGRWKPRLADPIRFNLGNAGTTTRFLAASALLSPVPIEIDGDDRMRERPIGELVDLLEELGASPQYLGKPGFPPVRIVPPAQPSTAATLSVPTTLSSQFISAMFLVAPFLPGGLTVHLEGKITSRSYIAMTLALLDQLGVTVKSADNFRIHRVSTYTSMLPGFDFTIEPDASSAVPFWAAAAILPGASCRVEGLDSRSPQADAQFPDMLARMGAIVIRDEPTDGSSPVLGVRGASSLAPIMADMSLMPDAALALAVVACFAEGRSIIRGLRTLRVKESDRIAALQTELAKVGVRLETSVLGDPDAITITPPEGGIDCSGSVNPVAFETYNDHRVAMSLALIGLKRPRISIGGARCVSKSFPAFWTQLSQLYR
jgi:3-phosphoshikimate 1-carboxyvinyltransferase